MDIGSETSEAGDGDGCCGTSKAVEEETDGVAGSECEVDASCDVIAA